MKNNNVTLSPSRTAHNAYHSSINALNHAFAGMSYWLPRMKDAQDEDFEWMFNKMIESLDEAATAARDKRKHWATIVSLRKGN